MPTKIEKLREYKNTLKENIKDNAVVNHVKSNQNVYIPIACIVGTLVVSHYWKNTNPGTVSNSIANSSLEIGGDLTMAGRDVINHNHAPRNLSYIVTDGNEFWKSQAAAAKALGESRSDVSKHINHGKALKGGTKLDRLGVHV